MKKIIPFVAALLLIVQPADALIVSVQGYGEVPADGLDITLTEGEEDILSGRYTMELSGTLLASSEQLTVTITRSAEGIDDEFCCGTNCTAGDGTTSETKTFAVSGLANWYAHYYPAKPNVQITYLFSDGIDARTIRVNYIYSGQGWDATTAEQPACKQIQGGQMVILLGGQTFSVQGQPMQ